jgi:hypothetical protein
MLIYNDIEQGSDEWLQLRCGVATASQFHRIITTQGKPSDSQTKYAYDLAGEVITGEPKWTGVYGSMQKGKDREEESLTRFEAYEMRQIQRVGFVLMDDGRVGCSPDGLLDDEEGIETKNAEPHVQIERHEQGWGSRPHYQQCQGCMWVTGRKRWLLRSYCRGMQPIHIWYDRDEDFIKKLSVEMAVFLGNVDELVKKYRLRAS